MKTDARQLDPVKYETFLHRLWCIGEEGRITVQRVSASPIVAFGGECITGFYGPDGTMILGCSGHLRFAAATSDAVRKIIESFGQNPGFRDGDQFFQNDPYVAGAHVFDRLLIKPVFFEGRLVAWVATGIHTADNGGLLRGEAYEVYHEGLRVAGLKIVEHGEIRQDTFRAIVEQCRDPVYVALDLKSCIAANNVCSKRYITLIEKYGIEFVEAAGSKIIRDSEQMARDRLRSLPDGTWVSKQFGSAKDRKTGEAKVFQVVCTMTKSGDELTFDFTGSAAQAADSPNNATLPCTVAQVSVALTATLFWDIPWSDGKLAPVKVIAPEGSILNCRFPAATGYAPGLGQAQLPAMCECIAKMLYAGGRHQDVSASLHSTWYSGGPGNFYGGHRRDGIPVPQGLYDSHGAGFGAKPDADGVDTAGRMHIPSCGISDVERIEMNYPLLYFARNHCPDGGGYGKFDGGVGSYRIFIVYGSTDLSVDYKPYVGLPEGGFGLFGGYPVGAGGLRAIFRSPQLRSRLQGGEYPTEPQKLLDGGWGEVWVPSGNPNRIPLPEYSLLADFVSGGGGYGDPLERDPNMVLQRLKDGVTTLRVAEEVYGVIIEPQTLRLDVEATRRCRERMVNKRLGEGKALQNVAVYDGLTQAEASTAKQVLRFHEYLHVAEIRNAKVIRCRCGHVFCEAHDNYKSHALVRAKDLEELSRRRLPSGEPYVGEFWEYICPGCGTMLQVDLHCSVFNDNSPLWDTKLIL